MHNLSNFYNEQDITINIYDLKLIPNDNVTTTDTVFDQTMLVITPCRNDAGKSKSVQTL